MSRRCRVASCDRKASLGRDTCWQHANHEPLVRYKRMRKQNPARAARAFLKNYGEPHPETGKTRGDAIRAMPCIVATVMAERQGWPVEHCARLRECGWEIRACHARARGMGGVKGDCYDLFPGCDKHHAEAGELPGPGRYDGSDRARFEQTYGVDLTERAALIAEQLTAQGYP